MNVNMGARASSGKKEHYKLLHPDSFSQSIPLHQEMPSNYRYIVLEFLSILKIFEVDATHFGETPVSVLLGGFEPAHIHSKANSFVVQFFRLIGEEEREGVMSS